MTKRWRLSEHGMRHVEQPQEAARFAERGLHPVALALLKQRGVEDEQAIEAFLNPAWDGGVHDPFLFRQMSQAVDRIFQARENSERITVHGDYDADGVSGSAVLMTTLNMLGCVVDSYIPHRDKEGYGMNPTSVRYLHERGTNLIVTVDCGIANVLEISLAKSLGMDTIVVDHHQFGETLPDGILIHPRLPGETYPFPYLAAVGVAWKFACALCQAARTRGMDISQGWEKWLLDFVSIATVTDMVPLVGENRILETYGLMVMNKTRRPGLKKLIEMAGYETGDVDTESIAFGLGPRINAAGRMDHASLALRVLLAENEEEASLLTRQLEDQNRQRQRATAKMMVEAEEQIEQRSMSEERRAPFIALWSDQWSPALVGLVAGKYLDKTGKPSVAIGKHGNRWIGSGRSFAAYDITQAVKAAGEGLLTHSGGHVQACGFSFSNDEHLPLFVERLQEHASVALKEEECVPLLPIDAEIGLDDVNWQLVETLKRFEPFGEGNKKPLFVTRALTVLSCDLVGQNKNHVRCRLRSPSGRTEQFIGFKLGERAGEMVVGKTVDVVYDVGVNVWNGRTDIQCKLADFRPSENAT